MSDGTASRSGESAVPSADHEPPAVVTVDFRTIRDSPNVVISLNVLNVVQYCLRRLGNQVLCLKLIRRPGEAPDPAWQSFVDIISGLPGLSPGVDSHWEVDGDARVGSEWRVADALGEPSMPMSRANREILGLPDFTRVTRIPRRDWGPGAENESEEHDESEGSEDGSSIFDKRGRRSEDVDMDDRDEEDDGEEEEQHGDDGQFMLVVHPRGQTVLVLAKYPHRTYLDLVDRRSNVPSAQSIWCRLCQTRIEPADMSKPCVFHPGFKIVRTPPPRALTDTDLGSQLPSPILDSDAGDDDSDPGYFGVRSDFGVRSENHRWSCCNRAADQSGCMVEFSHMSVEALEQWRRTWNLRIDPQEQGEMV